MLEQEKETTDQTLSSCEVAEITIGRGGHPDWQQENQKLKFWILFYYQIFHSYIYRCLTFLYLIRKCNEDHDILFPFFPAMKVWMCFFVHCCMYYLVFTILHCMAFEKKFWMNWNVWSRLPATTRRISSKNHQRIEQGQRCQFCLTFSQCLTC